MNTETDRERILTIREVAAELHCSAAHVSNLINGKVPGAPLLPHARIGRRVLVKEEWLHAFLESAKE